MSATPLVSELVLRWQERQQQGQRVTPEELCSDCPELLDELKRQIHAVVSMESFLGLESATSQGENTPSLERSTADYSAKPDRAFPAAPPSSIPGYMVLGELGRGGMGVVYKARDLALKRVVALKMVRAGSLASEAQRTRFRTEAEAAARLQHPHAVQVFAWGEHGGQPYFVLEFVDGPSLARKIRGQPQPPRDAARLVLLLARAVHAAHQKGIVHRDLKPANVLLAPPADEPALNTAYGCPKIADFGLAKLEQAGDGPTTSGCILGTPCYMAPEQATGKARDVGPATDIYALGAILYELLTGRPPFKSDGMLDTLELVRTCPPTPVRQLRPEVPSDLEAICLRCLEKLPQRRYASAAALADDLRRFLDGEALPQPPRSVATVPLHRFRWAMALGVVALLATALGLFLPVWTPRGETGAGGHTEPGAGPAPPEQGLLIPQVATSPFKGSIDIRVSEPKNARRQLLRLHEPAARPLRVGDEIRIEVELNQPGYLYVLWIDTEAKVLPVYPWLEGSWQKWREAEAPQRTLSLPEKLGEIYRIAPGKAGMEAVVLLVRNTPWPRDQDLPERVGELKPQPLLDPQMMAWCENGRLVKGEADRAPSFNAQSSSDVVLRTQQRLYEKLHEQFDYVRAVCFANQGGP